MGDDRFDILVSGGGIAGLMATAIFAQSGFRTLCTDPTPPVTDEASEGADLRSTAFLQPAQALLAETGLWDRLAPFATPLQTMRIVEAAGDGATVARAFEATDVSELPFGWNLPNWLVRRELTQHLSGLANATFCPGVGTKSVLPRSTEALAWLSDGRRLRVQLIVAADGRNSGIRQALGIPAQTTRYGQKALAFAVTHPRPHGFVSTEIHRSGGPFTLVPLPDRDGLPASAVVWMTDGPDAVRLSALPDAAFNAEMTARAAGLYGPLTLASRRTIWPIISQIAARFHGERTALIAEAAHVVPPIGAQGLNMSLADIRVLRDLALGGRDALGNASMLDRYTQSRWPEVRARLAGIDALNRVSKSGGSVVPALRAQGIKLIHDIPPVRRALMHAGLGAAPQKTSSTTDFSRDSAPSTS